MTYLPELRETLVRAAERQADAPAAAAAARPARRRRPPLGAFALMGASVLAIVVAGAVLVLARHQSTAPQSGGRPAAATPAQVRAVAQTVLGMVKLPSGAVASATNPAPGSEISGAPDKLGGRYFTDLYRYYRVPGTPHQVIDAINSRSPRGTQSQSGSAAGETSAASGKGGAASTRKAMTRIVFEGTTFELARVNGISRELAFQAVQLPGGGTALREDAEAAYGPATHGQNAKNPLGKAFGYPPKIPAKVASSSRTVAIQEPALQAHALRFVNALAPATVLAPGCGQLADATRILVGTTTVRFTPGCPLVLVVHGHGKAQLRKWPYAGTLHDSGEVKQLVVLMIGLSPTASSSAAKHP